MFSFYSAFKIAADVFFVQIINKLYLCETKENHCLISTGTRSTPVAQALRFSRETFRHVLIASSKITPTLLQMILPLPVVCLNSFC